MNKYRVTVISCIAALLMLFAGCDSTETAVEGDPNTAAEKTSQAYAEMEDLFSTSGSIERKNFSHVEKLYMEAVAADPNNPQANFGAAFAHILATFSDTSIINTVGRWEGTDAGTSSMLKFGIPTSASDVTVPTSALGSNLVKIIQVSMSSPPTISAIQSLVRTKLLPRINYAIARLAVVEQHPSFELKISGKMQGGPGKSDVYLDLTEVFLMDAMLQGMKAQAEQFLVFSFEMPDYSTKSVVAALKQDNPNFFVLAPDGAARALSVKTSSLAVIGRIRSALNFLKAETDNQNDDIIKQSNAGGIQETLNSLSRLETSLSGTLDIPVKNYSRDTTLTVIKISLSTFFSNLPQNPKQAWFPVYTVDSSAGGSLLLRWQANSYATFNFPDPTFSGLFPGLTNSQLKTLLYIEIFFRWYLDVDITDFNAPLVNPSVQLMINGKSYSPASQDGSSRWRFHIDENNSSLVQSIAVSNNGVSVPVEFYGPTPKVRFTRNDVLIVDITRAPQNITAQFNAAQHSTVINMMQYAYYNLERSVNNGEFSSIGSFYGSQYTDNNVANGTVYKYRAIRGVNYYSWNYYALRTGNYTNIVTVTTP